MKKLMKKIIALMITVLTVALMAIPTFAEPDILTGLPSGIYYEGQDVVLEVDSYSIMGKLSYTWYLEWKNTTYSFKETPSSEYINEIPCGGIEISNGGKRLTIKHVEQWLDGAEVYFEVEDGDNLIRSRNAYIGVGNASVDAPPKVTTVYSIEVPVGSMASIYATVEPRDGNTNWEYMWYKTDNQKIQGGIAVNKGAETTDTLSVMVDDTVPRYYYCKVVTLDDKGSRCGEGYSCVVCVQGYSLEEEETVDIEIISKPGKTKYEVGDELDLSGLQVRIWTTMGFYDSYNGENLSVSPFKLNTPGTQKITLTADDGVSTTFDVTVKAPETTTEETTKESTETKETKKPKDSKETETTKKAKDKEEETTKDEKEDEEDGKTYVRIKFKKFSIKMTLGFAIGLLIGGTILICGIIVLVIILIIRGNKKKRNNRD